MMVSSLLYINLDVAKHTIDDNDSESSSGVAPGITVIASAVTLTTPDNTSEHVHFYCHY